MEVVGLWRHAVKSLQGERLESARFEDDEAGIVGRLLALCAKPEAIRSRFAYIRPEEPISAAGNRSDLAQALGDLRPTAVAEDAPWSIDLTNLSGKFRLQPSFE